MNNKVKISVIFAFFGIFLMITGTMLSDTFLTALGGYSIGFGVSSVACYFEGDNSE